MEAIAMILTRIAIKEALVAIKRLEKRILQNMIARRQILEIRKRES
jgi:hypothetical protein